MDTFYYKVDFSNVKDAWDIHTILDESLNFAEPYFRNLDSLLDCLTDMLSDISVIELHGLEKLKKYDGYDQRLLSVFRSAKHVWGDEFSRRFLVTIIHEDGTREKLM